MQRNTRKWTAVAGLAIAMFVGIFGAAAQAAMMDAPPTDDSTASAEAHLTKSEASAQATHGEGTHLEAGASTEDGAHASVTVERAAVDGSADEDPQVRVEEAETSSTVKAGERAHAETSGARISVGEDVRSSTRLPGFKRVDARFGARGLWLSNGTFRSRFGAEDGRFAVAERADGWYVIRLEPNPTMAGAIDLGPRGRIGFGGDGDEGFTGTIVGRSGDLAEVDLWFTTQGRGGEDSPDDDDEGGNGGDGRDRERAARTGTQIGSDASVTKVRAADVLPRTGAGILQLALVGLALTLAGSSLWTGSRWGRRGLR